MDVCPFNTHLYTVILCHKLWTYVPLIPTSAQCLYYPLNKRLQLLVCGHVEEVTWRRRNLPQFLPVDVIADADDDEIDTELSGVCGKHERLFREHRHIVNHEHYRSGGL